MECSQRKRELIYHATGTAAKIDEARMEESAAMACSQTAMGMIDHVTGDVNAILGGDGVCVLRGGAVMGRAIRAAMVG